jgi:GT2 family glycosyltransferase
VSEKRTDLGRSRGVPLMTTPQVSVVIPVYRRVAELDRLLKCLAHDADAVPLEVVVVENRERTHRPRLDGLRKRLPIRRLLQRTGNQAACRNLGAEAAEAAVVLFLDSDLYCEDGGLRPLLLAASDLASGVRMCPVRFPSEPIGIAARLYDVPRYVADFEHLGRQRSLTFREFVSCAFMMRRAKFLAVGGFDATAAGYGYEDVEFARRLERAGLPLSFQDEGALLHHKNLTPRSVHERSVALGRAAVWFTRRDPEIEEVLPLGVSDVVTGAFIVTPEQLAAVDRIITDLDRLEQTYLRNPSDEVLARATERYAELERRGRYQGIVEALRENVGHPDGGSI